MHLMEGLKRKEKYTVITAASIVVVLVFVFFAFSAPVRFPVGKIVTIEEGETLSEISSFLYESEVIKSALWFGILMRLTGLDDEAQAGDYFFEERLSSLRIAWRLSNGLYGLSLVSIRVPEGATLQQMANIFLDRFDVFDPIEFLKLTEGREGYLFPDTYYLLPNIRAQQVVNVMEDNFDRRIDSIKEEIETFDKSLEEIIIMASIIEKEVYDPEDRRIVSGILWRRIEIDMPLQVDAPFVYIIGKASSELTTDDLGIDSPYNTYVFKGLPPAPISNPSLDSVLAAVEPADSDYLFYLSDRKGVTHYAETFEGHKQNKKLFLR